jgi:type IV pilus assembly protein PilY1
VDFLTGGMFPFPAFDTNNNNRIGSDDGLSSGIMTVFSEGGIEVFGQIGNSSQNLGLQNGSDGNLIKIPITAGAAGLRGRITWRELAQ